MSWWASAWWQWQWQTSVQQQGGGQQHSAPTGRALLPAATLWLSIPGSLATAWATPPHVPCTLAASSMQTACSSVHAWAPRGKCGPSLLQVKLVTGVGLQRTVTATLPEIPGVSWQSGSQECMLKGRRAEGQACMPPGGNTRRVTTVGPVRHVAMGCRGRVWCSSTGSVPSVGGHCGPQHARTAR